MKKLTYLIALPIGLGLIWGFTIDVVNVFPNQEKEFTLVIDAGHGGQQKGSVVNGVSEKEITLALSKKIKAIAEEKGIKVIATRVDDSNISIQDRTKAKGSFLISLHVNAEPKAETLNGIEMFTSTSSGKIKMTKSLDMTSNLYQSLKGLGGIAVGNKPKQQHLYILENSTMPVVLLELGYLTNKKDFQFITNEQKQVELAKAIVDGVLNYKKNSKTNTEMKAMIENSKQTADSYMTRKKPGKDKSIVARAVKFEPQSVQGKIDSNKAAYTPIKVYPKPILLASSSVTVNNTTNVTHIKEAVMKVFNGELEAKEVEMDMKKGTITAKTAKFKGSNGSIIESELMIFNHKTGSFISTDPSGELIPTSGAFELLSNLSYLNLDSVKVHRLIDNVIMLNGKVKLKIDNYAINAKVVSASKGSNVLTLHLGSVKRGNEPAIRANRMEFDIVTKELYIGDRP